MKTGKFYNVLGSRRKSYFLSKSFVKSYEFLGSPRKSWKPLAALAPTRIPIKIIVKILVRHSNSWQLEVMLSNSCDQEAEFVELIGGGGDLLGPPRTLVSW